MGSGPVAGPTQTASSELDARGWESRPLFARIVRVTIFLFPLAMSVLASLWVSRNYPPERLDLNKWVWWLGLAIAAVIFVRLLERGIARITPLAMLFRLSLIFPDQAPSRFAVALKTGSTRSVKRRLTAIQESGKVFNDDDLYSEQMLELVAVLGQHDRMTRGHAERVRAYSELIGEEMGLGPTDLGKLRWSALLHDMGKLHVPGEILNKEGRPNDEEWAILKEHPAKAAEYLEPLADWLGDWRFAAVGHHERWDGNGYPAGQAGEDIPLSARIVAVADAFDVMTSTRSYKKPMPAELARQEVADKAGSQFDPAVSRAFMNIGLGDLRRTAGPLAFFTNLPIFRGVPLTNVITTTASSAASAATAAVALTINALVGVPAEPPATFPDPLAFAEEEPLVVSADDIAGLEDTDIAGVVDLSGEGPFTITIVEGPGRGEVVLDPLDATTGLANASFTYIPDDDEFGADDFAVRVCDSNGDCTDQQIDVWIAPVNDPPSFVQPGGNVAEGGIVALPLDISDPDDDPLEVTAISLPDNATVTVSGSTVNVVHDGSETDTVTFTLVLSDGTMNVTRQVVVDVAPVNDEPIAGDDAATTIEDQPLTIQASTLLANDTDADADALTIQSVGSATNGTVTQAGNLITFTPDPGFVGRATFTYIASDGLLSSVPAIVTIDVEPAPNEPPTITLQPLTVAENTATGTTVGVATGSDPEGGAVTFAITGGSGASAFTIDPNTGAIVASGPIDFESTPTFTLTVTVTDADGAVATTTITISVGDVNEPPVFDAPGLLSIEEQSPASTPVVNGTIQAPDPEGNAVTYTMVDLSNTFTIDPVTGEIELATATLDFETSSSYAVTIVASDGSLQSSLPIVIEVLDVNEAPIINPLTVSQIPEATVAGSVVSTVVASDVDADSLTYAIVGGTGSTTFTIDPATGTISVNGPLDFETTPSYTLDVVVTDDGTPQLSSQVLTVVLPIADVNDAPTIATGQTVTIAENTPISTVAAGSPIVGADADGDPLTFSISDPDNYFSIDPVTGDIVRTATPLDFETTPTHVVVVTVTDPSGASAQAPVAVTVLDQNDAPVIQPFAAPLTANENQTLVVLGTAQVTDPDGDVVALSLSGPGSSLFSVNAAGDIEATSPLDFETTPQFTLTLTATDNGSPQLSTSETVVIDVVDINEAPSVNPLQTFTISEDATLGTAVLTGPVVATDVDAGDTLTYAINDPLSTFDIDPATGQIKLLLPPLDFELHAGYPVTITVTDSDGLTSPPEPVTITIIDVNEPPTITGPVGPVSIVENSPLGTSVSTGISATDPETDQLTYTLNDPSGFFTIDPSTGEISRTATPLNFETSGTPITVVVTVDDAAGGGTGTDSVSIDIGVLNINEAPVFTNTALPAVPENTIPGAPTGTIAATDPETHPITYSIVGGTGSAIFDIDPNTGIVTLTAPVDFETLPNNYTLDIRATDSLGLSVVQTSGISITGVNEPPVIPLGQVFAIPEISPVGTLATPPTVQHTDPENDTVTWAINDPTNTFDIDPTTGEIATLINSLDFETKSQYLVDVTATDTGGLATTKQLKIDVLPVNEPPVFGPPPAAISIAEDAAVGSPVTTLVATDPDAGDTVTYSVVGGTGAALFQIDPNTGAIETNGALDYESLLPNPSYTLIIGAFDGALLATQTITIEIIDVNEAPTITAGQTLTMVDDAVANAVLGTVTSSDPDGDAVTYSIVGGTGQGVFMTTGAGEISLIAPIDYDDAQSYTLLMKVVDNGTPSLTSPSELVTIDVESQFGELSPHFGEIVFNEVMFSSHANNVFGDTDFVELLNISGATVPTAGWTLTDSPLHLGPDFNDLEVLIQAASIGPDVRLVQWIGLTTMGSAEAGTLEYGMNAPGPDNGLLRRNDDLFLYDANDQLVAYMGWGDKNAPTSQISVRPPMQTWGLWDPTFELQMRHSGRDSVSATPDGLNSTLSGCWERTGSGDAQLPGRCANPVATIDTDTDPNRRNSAGRDNTVAAPYTGTNLVISEYAVDGMAGGNADNFIEIFNPTPVAVDLSTVSLEIHRNGALQETVDLDFQAGTPAPAILNPGQALLLGEQGPGIFANPGVNSDLTFATKLNSWNYSFRIIDAAGSILDTVGSQSSTLFEGTGVAESYDDNSFPRSFQRRSSFRPAGCVDTDDNSLDITLGNTISPTRITAPLTPCTPHTYITDGSRTLTISEVQVNAWNDPDGFIELFNPSNPNVPVNLAGWQIYIGGSLSATLPAVTLAPGDHYLVGGTAYSGPAADFIMSDDVESTELLELRDPGGNPVVSIQFASQLLANLTNNSSYERGFGGCAHDGNPAVDFEWTSAPSPTVQGASIQPCS